LDGSPLALNVLGSRRLLFTHATGNGYPAVFGGESESGEEEECHPTSVAPLLLVQVGSPAASATHGSN